MDTLSTTLADEDRCHRKYRVLTRVCLAGTVVLALLGLVGWFFGITILGSLQSRMQPMVPGTALVLLTYCAVVYSGQRSGNRYSLLSVLFTVLAMLLALLTLVVHLYFPDIPHEWIVLENFFYKGPLRSHISPLTSVIALLTGTAMLFWFPQKPRLTTLAGWVNCASIITSSTFLLAYIYGSPLLYGSSMVPISLSTCIAFLLLSVALLGTFGPNVVPVSRFTDGTTRARLLSSFLPVVVLLTFLADIVPDLVLRSSHMSHALYMALIFAFIVLISVQAINVIARQVGQELDEAAAEVYRSHTSEQAEKDRLLVTLHSIGDGVIVSDTAGTLVMMNPIAEKLTGWTQADAEGRPVSEVFDIINETTRSVVESPISKVLESGYIVGLANHTLLRARNGTECAIADSGAPIRALNDAILGVVLVFRDVSYERRAEKELQEKDYFLTTSQRVAMIGSYKTDFVTGFWESSEILDTIFGIDAQYRRSVQGWLDIVHPDDADMMNRYLQDTVIGQRQPFNKDYRIRRIADGATLWVHGMGEVTFDDDGRLLTMIGTIQDITARKKVEEEQALLQTQLQQAQKMESVGRLAGGVAHDFNNMLGVILGNTQMAMERVDRKSSLYDDLTEIQTAAQRSADLTRQLLAFARKQTILPKKLDLNDTIEGLIKMLQRMIGENIQLQWRPMAGLWHVKMDPSQIDQMLAHLCVNASDAITDHGTITVETANITVEESFCSDHPLYMPGDFVRLTVNDDGCGMDEKMLLHIFEPFFTTKGVGEGTGLGLSTVYGAVKQNNGFIIASSEQGKGSTFTIYLPRYQNSAGGAYTDSTTAPIIDGPEPILLVEDQPAVLRMTSLMLQRAGYSVMAASTPSEAIRMAMQYTGEIHMVLTDVVMPEMNGKDLVKELLALYPRIKHLYMSGYTADIITDQGALEDSECFIQKPFTYRDITGKIRQLLAE
ncbi:MAG: hybrid sensor histidine kinase/response regulator [Armatimonadota bacterium]